MLIKITPSSLKRFAANLKRGYIIFSQFGMKAPYGFGIGFCNLLCHFFIFGNWVGKIILIHKIIPRAIRRVYVPADFDTIEKALSGAKAAEKGLK